MIYRILMFIICGLLLFIPIYEFVNYIFKRFNIFKESDNLADKLEKNKISEKQIKQEINNKINSLEKEVDKLNKVKGE